MLELETQKNDIEASLRETKNDISELIAQKENFKKQNNNYNRINIKKNFDVNEFVEEQESLEISNR